MHDASVTVCIRRQIAKANAGFAYGCSCVGKADLARLVVKGKAGKTSICVLLQVAVFQEIAPNHRYEFVGAGTQLNDCGQGGCKVAVVS